MHYCFYLTFDRKKADTSEAARKYAQNFLEESGFCSTDQRFGGGYADWFVIGGRWSGDLTLAHLDKAKLKEFEKEFKKKFGFWVGGKEKINEETRRRQSKQLFRKYFPDFKGEHPYWRNQYYHSGCPDDAMIIDKAILENRLKDKDGFLEEDEYFADVEYEKISDAFIGEKWIVVIDYHN